MLPGRHAGLLQCMSVSCIHARVPQLAAAEPRSQLLDHVIPVPIQAAWLSQHYRVHRHLGIGPSSATAGKLASTESTLVEPSR